VGETENLSWGVKEPTNFTAGQYTAALRQLVTKETLKRSLSLSTALEGHCSGRRQQAIISLENREHDERVEQKTKS